MDLVGQNASARAFHQWAVDRVLERAPQVRSGVVKALRGEPLSETDILHTRYRLDGSTGTDQQWPNFQLDGFGTWLWALAEHVRLSQIGDIPSDWVTAAGLVVDYLSALWDQPCYDCWEEFPDRVHPHTLAAIYGGLNSYACLTSEKRTPTLDAIQQHLLDQAEPYGYFVKFDGLAAVDASLLGLAVPYSVVDPEDTRMLATVSQIEATLSVGGGLHRYTADTYYGGGEWLLLTAWLGWYYCKLAQRDPSLALSSLKKAGICLKWIEDQAGLGSQEGWLPEQVPHNLNEESYFPVWQARWGQIAIPLLWSHANYLILYDCLRRAGQI
jgi:GH15 family glucan-1,4-alpha-glucosidase